MSLLWSLSAAFGILVLGAPQAQPAKPKAKVSVKVKAKAKTKAKARHHGSHRVQHGKPVPLSRAPGSRAEAYGQLTPAACLALLDERHIPYSREEPKRGVKIPVRLTGKVGGVLYRTDFPDRERAHVPWEVFDCRLVLSLDDFSETLRAHSIAEVRLFSAWRPPAKSWPMSEVARRHQGALAIDVRELRKDNGEVLNVLEHFHGKLGVTQCVPAAPPPNPDCPEARELHELVCAASAAHIFNSILTPNYNPAHKNHFHLELTPDVDWFMLR
ncbi:MAG TPA: extensin family protein [Polyangiaceae bacterium]|nr:extensin family protein [Polyangiaceae bacterium]